MVSERIDEFFCQNRDWVCLYNSILRAAIWIMGCFFVVGNCNMYVIAVILTKFGPSVCNGGAQGVVVFLYSCVGGWTA